ncbi:MAG: hypothetical protein NTU41_06255 [Chloroflexi bacterium]|nr:hypothetical protein [Chloroflexota bacterium]
MEQGLEERLRSLEAKVERLEKAIPPKSVCSCGNLLTIHEEYKNVVYEGGSHAQCYKCGTYVKVKEPKWSEGHGTLNLGR